MGRRDAVQTMLEVVAECRRLLPGLIVTWEPGWETRGNGTSANYSYGSIHHTATPTSAARPFPTQSLLKNGRPSPPLPGPLCNVATPWSTLEQPRLHVMAAHPANHGGASRASGPVPKLSLFNPRSIGNEIDYAGNGPMSAGQLLVGHVFTRAVGNVLAGGNVEVVRSHQETSVTGKWDPGYAPGKTYDMREWRRIAASIGGPLTTGDDGMPNDDWFKWYGAVLDEILDRVKGVTFPLPGKPLATSNYVPQDSKRLEGLADRIVPGLAAELAALRAAQQELVKAIATVSQGDDIDVDALVARIEGVVESAVGDAAKLVQVEVSVKDAPSKS